MKPEDVEGLVERLRLIDESFTIEAIRRIAAEAASALSNIHPDGGRGERPEPARIHAGPNSPHTGDAVPSAAGEIVGEAEREVGRWVYRRIEALMDTKPGTAEAAELQFLSRIAESIEEYGEEACAGHRLSDLPTDPALYSALKAMVEVLGRPEGIEPERVRPTYDAALAAIAKAEGTMGNAAQPALNGPSCPGITPETTPHPSTAWLREAIALKVIQYECDRESMDWPEDKCRAILALGKQDHSGDCTKQPWTCNRCVVDDAFRLADAILALIPAPPSTAWQPIETEGER